VCSADRAAARVPNTSRPVNIAGYWDGILAFLEHAVAEGFLRPQHREMLQVADDPKAAVSTLSSVEIPEVEKWIGRKDR